MQALGYASVPSHQLDACNVLLLLLLLLLSGLRTRSTTAWSVSGPLA
jgi:hypothetical protein